MGDSHIRPYNRCVPAGDLISRPYNFRQIQILLFQPPVVPDGQLAQADADMDGGRLQGRADRVRLQHMHFCRAFFFRQWVAPRQQRVDNLFMVDQDRHEAPIQQMEVDFAVQDRRLASPFFDQLAGVDGLDAARVYLPQLPIPAAGADGLLVLINDDCVGLAQNDQQLAPMASSSKTATTMPR